MFKKEKQKHSKLAKMIQFHLGVSVGSTATTTTMTNYFPVLLELKLCSDWKSQKIVFILTQKLKNFGLLAGKRARDSHSE